MVDLLPQVRVGVARQNPVSVAVSAGLVAGELVPPDAFQVRLRGYVSRSVRILPSRPPKEPS